MTEHKSIRICLHPDAFSTVKYKNTIIRENLSKALYKLIADNKLENDWIEKGQYSQEVSAKIQWDIQAKALQAAPLKTKRFVCKWVSNSIPSGENMVKWKMRYKGSCPFCNLDKEDKNHILCCSHSEAVEVWKEGLSNLNSFLKRTKTDPWLRKIIIEELTSWHDFTTTDIKLYPSKYKKAILQQRQIGWKHF